MTEHRSPEIERSRGFGAFVGVAFVILAFGCSDHAHRFGTKTRVPAQPSVGSSTTAIPSGPPTIETCDDACAGCQVLVESDGKLRDWSRPLRPAEDALIDAFFLDYLKSSDCQADSQRLDLAAIGSNDDASSLKAVVDGAFTKANAKQTLVVFFAGHCGVLGAHADGNGITFSLLLEDERLIASSMEGPGGVELQPIDIDHDGFTELVDHTADYASGATFSQAAVWSFRDGLPKVVATFELSRESCNLPGGEHFESTLLARWDQARNTLCFLAKRREIGCPANP